MPLAHPRILDPYYDLALLRLLIDTGMRHSEMGGLRRGGAASAADERTREAAKWLALGDQF